MKLRTHHAALPRTALQLRPSATHIPPKPRANNSFEKGYHTRSINRRGYIIAIVSHDPFVVDGIDVVFAP
jgi:hypothetical protein